MPQPVILSETPSQTAVTLLQRFQGLSMSTKLSIGPPCFGLRVGLRLSAPNSGSASVYGSHAENIEADGEGAKEVFCRYCKRCHCGDIERQHDVRRDMPLEWLIVIGQMRLTPRNVLWWDGYYP
jgi:hypothetical protein